MSFVNYRNVVNYFLKIQSHQYCVAVKILWKKFQDIGVIIF